MPTKARLARAKRKAQYAAKQSNVALPTATDNHQDCQSNSVSTSLLLPQHKETRVSNSESREQPNQQETDFLIQLSSPAISINYRKETVALSHEFDHRITVASPQKKKPRLSENCDKQNQHENDFVVQFAGGDLSVNSGVNPLPLSHDLGGRQFIEHYSSEHSLSTSKSESESIIENESCSRNGDSSVISVRKKRMSKMQFWKVAKKRLYKKQYSLILKEVAKNVSEAFSYSELHRRCNDDRNIKKRVSRRKRSSLGSKKRGKVSSKGNAASLRKSAPPPPEKNLPNQGNLPLTRAGNTPPQQEVQEDVENPASPIPRPDLVQNCPIDRRREQSLSVSKRNRPSRLAARLTRPSMSRRRLTRPSTSRRNLPKATTEEPIFNKTFKSFKVYSRAKLRRSVFKLQSPEGMIAKNISSRLKGSEASSMMEANTIVKWCMLHRKRLLAQFKSVHKELVSECETRLTISRNLSNEADSYAAILGPRQHTSSSESYFHEPSYETLPSAHPPLIIDANGGKVLNVFPHWEKVRKHYKWPCKSDVCKVDEAIATDKVTKILSELCRTVLLRQAVLYVVSMSDCGNRACIESPVRSGHTLQCRLDDGNGAPIVVLENLMPHYPRVRSVVRQLQNLKRILHKVDDLDFALYNENVSDLVTVAEAARLKGGQFEVGSQKFTSEDQIKDKFYESFKAHQKLIQDLPRNYCLCCSKLLPLRSLKSVSNIREIDNRTWLEIYAYAQVSDASCDWICNYCHLKIKEDRIPCIASINQMEVPPTPPEIACLNSFEKMFIQLAKAFQVVVKAGTVMNKNIPATNLNSKVVGRTFHLPLPLERSIQRVLNSERTVLPDQQLFILVRGLPTKNRKIWESVVNFSNVLRALRWLKNNNPLYQNIEMPQSAEELLQYIPDTDTAPEKTVESDPDKPESDPDEPGSDPDEPGSDPDEPGSDPDEPNSDPDEPNSDPDEPGSDPDEPNSDPDLPPDKAVPPPAESILDLDNSDIEAESVQHNITKVLHFQEPPKTTNADEAVPCSGSSHCMSPQNKSPDDLLRENICSRQENIVLSDHVIPGVHDEPVRLTRDQNVSHEISQARIDADNSAAEPAPDKALPPEHPPKDSLPNLQNLAAMLTQSNENDEFYAPYTIFPIYDKRENKLAKDLYQMLKVQEPSLDSRTAQLDAMCFPDLFPDGKNFFQVDRDVHVDFSSFVHAKLLNRKSLFRKNIQYLFFLLNQATMRELAAGIYQVLNVSRGNITASEFLKKVEAGELDKDLTSIFGRVRNTEEYWKKPRSQILSMIETYGPPTFFLTLSPAEYDDKDLEAFLKELEGDEGNTKQTAALIASEPLFVSLYYAQKLRAMIGLLSAPGGGPLRVVEHYTWRREYQGRGTQHFHSLIWVKDAPVIGKSSSDEVAEFIQEYITCAIPDKKSFPTLHARVTKYQQHHCNDYCKRTKKTNGGVKKVCRFDFPRSARSTFELRDAPTAIAGRRNLRKNCRLYDLPRAKGAEHVNDYNPAILLAWVGNMDIQYVGESSAIIAKYISKYQTKAEKSHMTDVFDDIASNEKVQRRLWNVGLRCLANRECGALEAADTLMSVPLHGTDPDTTFQYVDVNILRSRRVKSKKEVEMMQPDDPNLFYPSLIDNHYPNRPNELNDLCLYDYAKDWDIIKERPVREPLPLFYAYGSKFLRKRKQPHIVQHCKFDPRQKPEQYFYSLLLLFKPWRQIKELRGQYETYAEAFNAEKDTLQEAMQYHEKLCEIAAAHDAVTELIEAKCKEFGEENPELPNDDLLGPEQVEFRRTEAQRAMEDFHLAENLEPEVDLSSMEEQLNSDQRRIYEHVQAKLTHYARSNEEKPDDHEAKDPLRQIVSGVGGTGKSFLIKVITLWVKQHLNLRVALTAPTGAAARAIKGVTIHRLLQLPVEHGDSLKYTRLSDHVLEILRTELKNVALIVIDEMSMVSNVNFMMVHLRLSEIYNCHEEAPFGGINIMLVGDLLQLSPVKGGFIFQNMTLRQFQKHFPGTANVNLWTEYFTDYDELLINMRQSGNPELCQLLDNVRLGICTDENLKTLQGRLIDFQSPEPEKRLEELATFVHSKEKDGLCLLPERKMCKTLNDKILSQLDGEEIHLVAEDSIECKVTEKSRAYAKLQKLEDDASRTAGLDKHVVIKENAKIMLLKNVDVPKGHVNGETGNVETVSLDSNKRAKALKLRMEEDILELREPETGKFELQPGIFVHRKQFPIRLSYAVTIHKSQALTLDTVVADIGSRVFTCGQAYVALSRVKTLEGLHLINLDPQQIKANQAAIAEYGRLRRLTPHLKHLVMQTSRRRNKHIPDNRWAPSNEGITSNIYGNSPTPKKGVSAAHWPAFINSGGKSSYANASLQCLLSYEPLRNTLRVSAEMTSLQLLARQFQYKSALSLSAENVRQDLGCPFDSAQEQNPSLFLGALIDKNKTLEQSSKFTLIRERRCKACNNRTVNVANERILRLPSSGQNKVKITELLDNVLSWSAVLNSVCSECKKDKEVQRSELQNLQDLLLIEMPLWVEKKPNGELVKNTKLRSPGLQTTTITIGNHRYRLHGALFQHGPDIESGHCNAFIMSGKKFVLADDSSISAGRWPNGSADAQILFYRRLDPSNIGPKQKKTAPVKDAVNKGNPPASRVGIESRDAGIARQATPKKGARRQLLVDVPIAKNNHGNKNNAGQPSNYAHSLLNPASKIAHPELIRRRDDNPDLSRFPRFSNNLERGFKVSCYANATLQALLSYQPLRSALMNHPNPSALSDLAYEYQNYQNGSLSAARVRALAEERFMQAEQQCACDFMATLINANAVLHQYTRFTAILELNCTTCNTVRSVESVQHILHLPINGSKNNIQALCHTLSRWSQPGDDDCQCSNILPNGEQCQGKCITRTIIQNPSDILIIQVLRTCEVRPGIFLKNNDFQVTDLPTTKLTLGEAHYELHADVRHLGRTFNEGHYTAILRYNECYVEANDDHIKAHEWGGSDGRSSYLLMYKKIK